MQENRRIGGGDKGRSILRGSWLGGRAKLSYYITNEPWHSRGRCSSDFVDWKEVFLSCKSVMLRLSHSSRFA